MEKKKGGSADFGKKGWIDARNSGWRSHRRSGPAVR